MAVKFPPTKVVYSALVLEKAMYRLRRTKIQNPVGNFQDAKADYSYKAPGIYIKKRSNYECRQEVDAKINQKISYRSFFKKLHSFNRVLISQL